MRCGMPRRPSASANRFMCFLLRNSTAPVVGSPAAARASRTSANHAATRSASASRPVSNTTATSPRGAPGRGRSGSTGSGDEAASGASTASAAVSTSTLPRQLVMSEKRAQSPPEAGAPVSVRPANASAKPPRLPALAPRQP